MNTYDVIIIGGATTGSFFARRIAEAGRSVLVIEKLAADTVGSKYDIFHIGKPDFNRFKLPMPEEGDDLAFTYNGTRACSAFGRYPKQTEGIVVGMHMQRYTARLNRWAKEAGAEYVYKAEFTDFIFEEGHITGIRYEQDGKAISVNAGFIADCTGIPSVARRKLPEGYGVETFEITPMDMFYVTLRYVRYLDPSDYLQDYPRTWTFYKTWEAPEADPAGAILGVGANIGFEYGERVYKQFTETIKLPPHELKYKECGTTPYRRPPYSFVADNFIVMGDAACLTKPHAGEGVTSSMVQAEIAAEVVISLLRQSSSLNRQALWPINKRYIEAQGKAYAGSLATLTGAVASSAGENDYFFKHDIIFSQKTFSNMDGGIQLTASELIAAAAQMFLGVITGKIKIATVRALLKGMKNGSRVTQLYAAYPETPDGFEEWVRQADDVWARCGSMADNLLAAENATQNKT